MRKKLKIEIGKIYGRLKVVSQIGFNIFECECSCGKICNANSSQLFHGKKKSCGCQKIDSARKRCEKWNYDHGFNGFSKTKEYKRNRDKNNRIKFREVFKERKRIYNRENKLKVFSAYCKDCIIACAKCKETDDRVLNIDHIDGGGRKHQREVSGIYRDLIRRGFPEGFQVLCQNCNWVKMHENNECHRNSNKGSDASKKSNQKLHLELINYYSKGSMSCKRCGENDVRVLCLDHIDGKGSLDRIQHGNGVLLWRSIKKRNFPDTIQILCQNCNRRKMYENDEWRGI